MMGVTGAEQSLCKCCKARQDFNKVVELKDSGLIVYCHSTRRDDVIRGEIVGSAINTYQDVFILHNTKDEKITCAEFTPDLEKQDISCPRCRQIFENAQALLQQVKSIDRRNVMGICDHCRKKAQSIKKPCNECEEIVKKFLSTRRAQKENTKQYIKTWLSQMRKLLQDSISLDKPDKDKTHAYCELQVEQLCRNSLQPRREPEVEQLFDVENNELDTNLNEEVKDANTKGDLLEKSVLFTRVIEPFAVSQNGPCLVKSDATFVEPHKKVKGPKTALKDRQDQISEYYDESSMDVKEAIKRKHDLNLRKIVRPEIYEIPKIAPWEQPGPLKPVSKYVSESDIKLGTRSDQEIIRESQSNDSQSDSNRPVKYESSKTSLKKSVYSKGAPKRKHMEPEKKYDPNSELYRIEKKDHGKIKKGAYDSEEIPTKLKKRDHHLTDEELNFQRSLSEFKHEIEKSDQQVIETITKTSTEAEKRAMKMLKRQFSFFFPESKKKKATKIDDRSSVLIRNTREKMRKKVDEEKQRQIKEQTLKLEEEEKKKLAREEKKQQAEEKKFLFEERNNAEEERIKESEKGKDEKEDKEKLKSSSVLEQRVLKAKESEYSMEDLEQKIETKDQSDKEKERAQKGLKGVLDSRDKDSEIEVHGQKDLKSKTEKRDKSKDALEKAKKDGKSKSEQKYKSDEAWEKATKDLKSKTEQKDKSGEVSEKVKITSKSKPDLGQKLDDSKKDRKSKAGLQDKVDEGEKEKAIKSKSDKEKKDTTLTQLTPEQKQIAKQEKDRLEKNAHLQKEKESTSHKKQDTSKEEQALSKKKKELSSKEKDESYKQKLGPTSDIKDHKKQRTSKETEELKKQLQSKEMKDKEKQESFIKEPLAKKQMSTKETDDVPGKKQGKLKKTEEPSKTIHDSTQEKEEPTGKEKKSFKKDEKSKFKEESTESKKAKDGIDDAQFRKMQAELAKEKELKKKNQQELEEQKARELAVKRAKEEGGKIKGATKQAKDKKLELEEQKARELADKRAKEEVDGKSKSLGKEAKAVKSEPKRSLNKEESFKSKKEIEQVSDMYNKTSFKKDEKSKLKEEITASKKAKDAIYDAQFRKMQAELVKEKEKELKKKKQQELEEQKARELADKRAKEEDSKTKGATKQPKDKKPELEEQKARELADKRAKEEGGKIKGATKEAKDNKQTLNEEESMKPKKEKEKNSDVPKKAIKSVEDAQFRKLLEEHKKNKEAELKKKLQEELEAQKAKELADKQAKEEMAKMKGTGRKGKMKIRNTSSDDLILRLVRIKQTALGPWKKPLPKDIDPEVIKAHKCHHQSGQTSAYCILCQDSELEMDVESYVNKMAKSKRKSELADIIIGEKILKYKPPLLEPPKEEEVIPILFQSLFREESLPFEQVQPIIPPEPEEESAMKNILATILSSTKEKKGVESEPAKGIIRYALSDRTFIDKGWTMLPTEKVVRKMNVYRMRPAHPEFDWFEHNKNKRVMTYDSGEKLAEFDDNGRGRWYYKSGRLALDYYDAEETNAQQRFVIYSSGEPDERGRTHPITVLATFDYLGNGIVFDHAGKIRLKYNQTEGVVLDRGIGPVSHWKWHTLNDPPVLQQVMIDTQMAHKDPAIVKLGSAADNKARPDNEEMLAIEFDNFIKEKSKKLSQKFKPFQIKMKALKINEHFSLKVLDQATIYLIFRDGSTNLKLNIGMILDHQEIVDTDTAEVGEVSNNLERFPARTDSLAGLQRSVAYAQRYERQRTERERRLRPSEPCASADQLTAAASSPLRPPLRTIPIGPTTSTGYCNCRKPTNNLYYNTRLL